MNDTPQNAPLPGNRPIGNDKAILVVIEFDSELLHRIWGEGGVASWNSFVGRLFDHNITPPAWDAGNEPMPICVSLDFNHLRMPHYHLDGINLVFCWLEKSNFTGASLKNAKLGSCPNALFNGARLHGCEFFGDISGCDFTEATGLDVAKFELAVYEPNNFPVGLPPGVLAICKPFALPPPENPRLPRNPMEPTYSQGPLQCSASINFVPTGE